MCLQTINFSMTEYDRSIEQFIGYGYKKIDPNYVKKYGGQWLNANFNYGSPLRPTPTTKLSSKLSGSDEFGSNKVYLPGFHIFLEEDAAKVYGQSTDYLCKVAFYNVIGFGTNEAGSNFKDCVITTRMKILSYKKNEYKSYCYGGGFYQWGNETVCDPPKTKKLTNKRKKK